MEENIPSEGARAVAWLTHLVCKHGRVNSRDGHEQTILHLACGSEDEDDHKFIEVLLRSGADINAQDKKGNTPLHMACQRINESVVETLLRSGADVRVVNDEGRTPLHVVANLPNIYRRDVIVVKALLANFTDKGSDENSSQLLADHAKGDKLVSLVNKQDHRGNTALHLASARKNLNLVCLLLKRDAKVGVQNSDGMTALNMACSIAVNDSCKLDRLLGVLINHGEDVNAQDAIGNTPLHTASINNNQEVVGFLLRSGAKVGVKNYEGMTALHSAARACAESVVVALVDYGAHVAAKDFEGNTPLHNVCSQWSKPFRGKGCEGIANLFIIRGAKIDERNNHLKTPYDYVATISLWDKLYEKIIEEFAIKQVIRLKSLGLQKEFNINWILGTKFYDSVRTRCCTEIEKMKLTMIVKNISLYQVLSHIDQPFILPTEDLLPIDELLSSPDLLTRFPLYGDILRITFQRAKLLTLAVQSFYSEQRKQMMKKLPCEVTEHLLTFLSNEALRSFIKSEYFE